MNIGGQARPLRTREEVEAQLRTAVAAASAPSPPTDEMIDEAGARAVPWRMIAGGAAGALALGWLLFLVYARAGRASLAADPVAELPGLVATAAAPLALIGIAWLLLARTSRREARRYAGTAEALRDESARLEHVLAQLSDRMDDHRRLLADNSDRLLTLGDSAQARMGGISHAMGEAGAAMARQSDQLSRAAASARGDLDLLLSDLPRAEAQVMATAGALRETGLIAHEQAGALEDRLVALAARGREADEATGGAAQRLAAQLGRLEGASAAADRALHATGTTLREETEAALARTAAALAEARAGIDAEAQAMRALVGETAAAWAATGAGATRDLDDRLAAATRRVSAIGETLGAQAATANDLLATLHAGADDAEARFATFATAQRARIETLVEAIGGLRAQVDRTVLSLGQGNGAADALIARADAVQTATDAIAASLGTRLPPLLDDAVARSAAVRATSEAALPAVHALTEGAAAAAARLDGARRQVEAQQAAILAMSDEGSARLDMLVARAQAFAGSLTEAGAAAGGLSESAAPALVEALIRVRETATHAAERARATLGGVIPEAADALGRASAEALERALTGRVEEQMTRIVSTAEEAVRSAHTATDRLMRQMLTIADTTSAVERRIEEARAEAQAREEESFPRQSAVLIESLNSLSIDIARAMTIEPGDAAWTAYMRGDRSVFTRRAVKLLDGGQLKEVARHYEADANFRDQVNRYIHDFEAMLRRVLDTREGSSLGVTLLSSDIGKLYVALAQSIERLRT